MNLSDSVLIESKSARDQGLSAIAAKGSQERILNKVRVIFFSLWRGEGYLTIEEVAVYYDVPKNTIAKNVQRCREEFLADGVKVLRGNDLRDAKDTMSLPSTISQITLFPPRAVIRMGFILQESLVAAQVRTAALNVLQGVGNLVSSEEILSSLLAGNPPYKFLIDSAGLKLSTPLGDYYDAISKKLRSSYPTGGIPGMKKEQIREKLAALSTYTKSWKLNTQKEIKFCLKSVRTKYPDLVTDLIPVNVDGQTKKAIFIFQIEDLIVELEDIEDCVGRQYAKLVKQYCMADFVYHFLVAPFGATPDVEMYVKTYLHPEIRGFIGIITVKELAEFLRKQAWDERSRGLVKGGISDLFKEILKYEIPTAPLSLLMGLTS